MLREYIERTFFEKLEPAVLSKIPDFYKNDFPWDTGIVYKFQDKPRNNIKELEGHVVWNKFMANIHEQFIRSMRREQGSIEKMKKKVEVNDTLFYVQGLYHPDEEKNEDKLKTVPFLLVDEIMEFMWDFHDNGHKTFKIEQQLSNELYHTDITKIYLQYLNLPYQTILIHIPFNEEITVRKEVLKWVCVSEFEEDNGKFFRFLFVSKEEGYFTEEFSFTSGDIFEQVKAQSNERWKSKVAAKENVSLVKFVMATLLYINSVNPDKTDVIPNRSGIKETSVYPICSLGRNIKIEPSQYNFLNEKNDNPNKLHILKWMVRGHFRQQKWGYERKLKKTIWIRPFLKGTNRTDENQVAKPINYVIPKH